MTSRGLPGFLRRSRRRDEFEDDASNDTRGDNNNEDNVEYDDEEAGDNENGNDDSGNKSNNHNQADPQLPSTDIQLNTILDPSPLVESSAQGNATARVWNRHDGKYGVDDDQNALDRDSVSTLGDSDHVLEDTLPTNAASRSNVTPARTTSTGTGSEKKRLTYRELQFEKVLADQVVKMAELRTVGWNGIPVSSRRRTVCMPILHYQTWERITQ
jgi:hypothetical protein